MPNVAQTQSHDDRATPPNYLAVPKLDRATSTPVIESSQSSHAHTITDNERDALSMSLDNVRKQSSLLEEDILSKSLPLYGNKLRPPNLELFSGNVDPPNYYTPLAQSGKRFPLVTMSHHLVTAPYISIYDEEIQIQNRYCQCVCVCRHIVHLCSCNEFPFISSCDLVEHKSPYKPGCNVLGIFKDVLEFRDITYCLLQGRPLVIVAQPKDERYTYGIYMSSLSSLACLRQTGA